MLVIAHLLQQRTVQGLVPATYVPKVFRNVLAGMRAEKMDTLMQIT